jgi:hypothetical protein
VERKARCWSREEASPTQRHPSGEAPPARSLHEPFDSERHCTAAAGMTAPRARPLVMNRQLVPRASSGAGHKMRHDYKSESRDEKLESSSGMVAKAVGGAFPCP